MIYEENGYLKNDEGQVLIGNEWYDEDELDKENPYNPCRQCE